MHAALHGLNASHVCMLLAGVSACFKAERHGFDKTISKQVIRV